MLKRISPDALAAEVTRDVYERARELSRSVGAQLKRVRSPLVAEYVVTVVNYAQGGDGELSNDQVAEAINSLIDVLSVTCYPPATLAARAIFDRRAGEPQTEIEGVLLAARGRWNIELGVDVPIRWLAVLGGVSVKTARNLASAGQLLTETRPEGQAATATEADRWLRTRNIIVAVGSRVEGMSRRPKSLSSRVGATRAG